MVVECPRFRPDGVVEDQSILTGRSSVVVVVFRLTLPNPAVVVETGLAWDKDSHKTNS